MESQGPLPHSQKPATCPFLEPDQSIPWHHRTFWRSVFVLSSHLRSGLTRCLFPMHVTCPTHVILLDLINRIIFVEKYRSWSSSLCSLLHSPISSSLLGPNTLLSTLFSNTLSLRSSLNVGDQVSHSYETTGRIIVLYLLMRCTCLQHTFSNY